MTFYRCTGCGERFDHRCPDGPGCKLEHPCISCGAEVIIYEKYCKYPCFRLAGESEYCYIHEPRVVTEFETSNQRINRDAQHLYDKAGLALQEYGGLEVVKVLINMGLWNFKAK